MRGKIPQANAAPTSGGRRLKTIAVAVLAAALALAGCGAGEEGNTTGQAEDVAGRNATGATPGPQTKDESEAPTAKGGEGGFTASAESSGGEAGAADQIEGVRFQIFDDYERLLIGFGRDDGDAGVPRWAVESPAQGG